MITFGSEGKLISTGENTDFDHLRFFTTIDLNIPCRFLPDLVFLARILDMPRVILPVACIVLL